MIINIQPLPRLRPLSQTPLDLRQLVILGPLLDNLPYPLIPFPIAADLRAVQPPDAQWKGAMVLGGSTETLTRHWGDGIQFAKICTYIAPPASHLPPCIVEYLSVVDPQGYHLFYKCRRRVGHNLVSYVFPEKIDYFAHRLSTKLWYETPVLTLIAAQIETAFDDWRFVADTFFSSIEDNINAVNGLAYDRYDHRDVVTELHGFMGDYYKLTQRLENQADDEVYAYWHDQSVPILNEKDIFLQNVLLSKPMAYRDLVVWHGPNTFDLSASDPLVSIVPGTPSAFEPCYLPIAKQIEQLVYTDFAVTLYCDQGNFISIEIEYIVNRFLSTMLEAAYQSKSLFKHICVMLYKAYELNKPYARNLTKVRIVKSFNEEALFEFYHHDSMLDHAIHVDFALLSYCSPGLGRFFNRATDTPF